MNQLVSEWQRDLLRAFGARLEGGGFVRRAEEQSFERPIDGGRVSVHLGFVSHSSDFDVTVDFGIRFDAVEELVNGQNPHLSKKEKLNTFTLGCELGNLEGRGQRRWVVAHSSDIRRVADGISVEVDRVGLPYFEKYSQPAVAYEVLSQDDKAAWLHSPIHLERAKAAYALLVVLGRNSELPGLAEKKLAFLRSRNERDAEDFATFVVALDRYLSTHGTVVR